MILSLNKTDKNDSTKHYTLVIPCGVKLKTKLPKGTRFVVKEY